MVLLMLNHKTFSDTCTVAPTPQDRKNGCHLGHPAKASRALGHEILFAQQQIRAYKPPKDGFTAKKA